MFKRILIAILSFLILTFSMADCGRSDSTENNTHSTYREVTEKDLGLEFKMLFSEAFTF